MAYFPVTPTSEGSVSSAARAVKEFFQTYSSFALSLSATGTSKINMMDRRYVQALPYESVFSVSLISTLNQSVLGI